MFQPTHFHRFEKRYHYITSNHRNTVDTFVEVDMKGACDNIPVDGTYTIRDISTIELRLRLDIKL